MIKNWKSSLIGIIILLSGLGYVFYVTTPDYIIMSILIAIGIALLFCPDDIIKRLKDLIKTKQI